MQNKIDEIKSKLEAIKLEVNDLDKKINTQSVLLEKLTTSKEDLNLEASQNTNNESIINKVLNIAFPNGNIPEILSEIE